MKAISIRRGKSWWRAWVELAQARQVVAVNAMRCGLTLTFITFDEAASFANVPALFNPNRITPNGPPRPKQHPGLTAHPAKAPKQAPRGQKPGYRARKTARESRRPRLSGF